MRNKTRTKNAPFGTHHLPRYMVLDEYDVLNSFVPENYEVAFIAESDDPEISHSQTARKYYFEDRVIIYIAYYYQQSKFPNFFSGQCGNSPGEREWFVCPPSWRCLRAAPAW